MAIVQTLSKSSFVNAFQRSSRAGQFSVEALESIFDYLEDYSDSTGESVELDIVGICCEFEEQDYKDVFNTYPIDSGSENPADEEIKQAVEAYLSSETCIVGDTGDSFVFVQF